MTKQIFKQMAYQAKASQSVVDCFAGQPRVEGISYQIDPGAASQAQVALFDEGYRNADLQLSEVQLLQNIRAVQGAQYLVPSTGVVSSRAAPVNLDVEMETGTGKTYVYIDTMYRLYEQYGWSKFIIVVPSIAIREGVAQTLEDTEDHFQALYGHKIRRFIYDSSRPEPIMAFADSPGLHCMIINTQAFASEIRGEGRESKTLRMFREMDQFGSRKPIDLIAANRPILILDEPQRMEGSTTQGALARFKSPIALRYSATHRTRHNLVHRLDALDAYNRKLVKKISVRGVTAKGLPGLDGYLYLTSFRTFTDGRKPEARVIVEYGLKGGTIKRTPMWLRQGDNIEEKSGGLTQYRNYVVSNIDTQLRLVEFTNGEVLEEGRVTGDSTEKVIRRVQIRETIRAHFERERLLHPRGIKVLSLFFIDEVAKYRHYSEEGERREGEYAAMFEEEFTLAVEELKELDTTDAAWLMYVKRDTAKAVHDGYFSIDKRGHLVDPDVNRTGDERGEAKDSSSYDLILKDKARLLSIEEPVRFIFSHSALREGWDNPNVFTICTLKQSDHEIGKRQEVGRGLRISVDDQGHRTDGPEVHDINLLTVVASESYEEFANGLQSEIADALKSRPREASVSYFTDKVVQAGTSQVTIDDPTARLVHAWLMKNDFVDHLDHIQPQWHEQRAALLQAIKDESGEQWDRIPEGLRDKAEAIVGLIDAVYDQSAVSRMVSDKRKTILPQVRRQNLEKQAFQELWKRINQKAVYFTEFDSGRLVRDAIGQLDASLQVDQTQVVVAGADLETGLDVEAFRTLAAFGKRQTRRAYREETVDTNVRFDIVGQLASLTRLTRGTAGAILTGISPKTFAKFRLNPEMFLRKAAEIIRRVKVNLAIESLRYEKTGETYDVSIFETDRPEVSIDRVMAADHHVYDVVVVDSEVERTFAKELDDADEVIVYAKLPRGFFIPTPGGNYNPDWAIAIETPTTRQIYFVAETKGSMLPGDITQQEQTKIDSAARYFEDLGLDVLYRKVDSYDAMLNMISQP